MTYPTNFTAPHWQAALAANRYGYGAFPGDLERIQQFGIRKWLMDQITLSRGDDDYELILGRALPRLRRTYYPKQSPDMPFAKRQNIATIRQLEELRQQILPEFASFPLKSLAPVHERLVRFWMDRFRVASSDPHHLPLILDFEVNVVRRHLTGSYYEFMVAALKHPAMLVINNNAASAGQYSPSARGNDKLLDTALAKLILYRLTLGPSHEDIAANVTPLAHGLSGWSVTANTAIPVTRFDFKDDLHQPGPQNLLGKYYADEGVMQAEAMLWDLAKNPFTAMNLSFALAQHFLGDNPPKALVEDMAAAYMNHNGNIANLLSVMIDHPQAWQMPAQIQERKLKSPMDLVLSAIRGFTTSPNFETDIGNIILTDLTRLGQPWHYFREGLAGGDFDDHWLLPDLMFARGNWIFNFVLHQNQFSNGKTVADRALQILGPLLSQDRYNFITSIRDGKAALLALILSPDFQRR